MRAAGTPFRSDNSPTGPAPLKYSTISAPRKIAVTTETIKILNHFPLILKTHHLSKPPHCTPHLLTRSVSIKLGRELRHSVLF
ncbi:hypothetical protein SBA4_1150008 [Candidatus Sulfopaludibacter sp. SbA4]|nr:hypothetical protein SBA4_1150008 [Candidatus Sulfopaludibacter sp. SbA4]